jgi:Na+/proline symporter
MIKKINEVSIWLWVALSTLPCRQALAVDADTVENVTRRGLGMAMWVAIGVFGILGLVIFGTGVMRMWDTDDPRQKKSGMARMGWGVFLLLAVMIATGLKMYLADSAGPAASDVNPFGESGMSSPDSMF